MARVACLLITDGRPCLQETLASAEEFLFPYIDGPTVLVSDTTHKLGLSGAVREGWRQLVPSSWFYEEGGYTPYVFHLEDDWVFREPVPVDDMVALLDREGLWQVALKRDRVYHEPPGGFMEANPHNYKQRGGWTESFFGFTFNPCIYSCSTWGHPPTSLKREWEGEAGLTQQIVKHDPSARFGIFGNVDDPPRCFHIGHQRSQGWRL